MKVILHGYLRKLFSGKFIEIDGRTIADAIEGASLALFGRRCPKFGERTPVVTIPGVTAQRQLYEPMDLDEVHLVPVLSGGGGNVKSGGLQILIGAVIVALTWWTGIGGTIGTALYATGIGLMIGGLMMMLTPMPETHSSGTDKKSKYLGAPKDTVAIGTPIAIIYGQDLVGGHYLAYDVDSDVEVLVA